LIAPIGPSIGNDADIGYRNGGPEAILETTQIGESKRDLAYLGAVVIFTFPCAMGNIFRRYKRSILKVTLEIPFKTNTIGIALESHSNRTSGRVLPILQT